MILVCYADDSTLFSAVPSPRDRVSVAASLNRDLDHINDWCQMWGMLVNPSKTKPMIISRSHTAVPPFPDLTLSGSVIEVCGELTILGVCLDSKLTFESHIRAVASAAASKLGILRKTLSVFQDPSLVVKCFWSFLLPVLEYCSVVWRSAADGLLRLLDRVVRAALSLSAWWSGYV